MSKIIDNLCLQVTGWHRDEIKVRDTNTWLEWEVTAWASDGKILVSISEVSDDKRAAQLCNSPAFESIMASTIYQDCPDHIDGYEYGVEYSNVTSIYTHESYQRECCEVARLNAMHRDPADVFYM